MKYQTYSLDSVIPHFFASFFTIPRFLGSSIPPLPHSLLLSRLKTDSYMHTLTLIWFLSHTNIDVCSLYVIPCTHLYTTSSAMIVSHSLTLPDLRDRREKHPHSFFTSPRQINRNADNQVDRVQLSSFCLLPFFPPSLHKHNLGS